MSIEIDLPLEIDTIVGVTPFSNCPKSRVIQNGAAWDPTSSIAWGKRSEGPAVAFRSLKFKNCHLQESVISSGAQRSREICRCFSPSSHDLSSRTERVWGPTVHGVVGVKALLLFFVHLFRDLPSKWPRPLNVRKPSDHKPEGLRLNHDLPKQ